MHVEASLPTAPSPPKRPAPHRCDLAPGYASDNFVPQTIAYADAAKKYEKYNNNNCTFNEKSLSDNRKITNYYLAKERGVDYVHRKKPINEAHVENQ